MIRPVSFVYIACYLLLLSYFVQFLNVKYISLEKGYVGIKGCVIFPDINRTRNTPVEITKVYILCNK